MSVINLLTTSELKSDQLSVSKPASGLVAEGGVSKFQATLEGLMNGTITVAQGKLNTGENGELDLEALKGLNQEQLVALLTAQGITPEMLVDAASQLQATGSIEGLSPEQTSLLQLLGGIGALGENVEGASLASIVATNTAANVTDAVVTGATAENAGSLLEDGVKEGSVKSTVATLTQLAQAMSNLTTGKTAAANSVGAQNNVILEASETNVGVATVVATAAHKINQEGVIAPVDTGADDSQPLDPQNIASTLLNAGAVINAQSEGKPVQANSLLQAGNGLENADQGKVNPLTSTSNGGGNAENNGGFAKNANPLLAQLNQGKSNPFSLASNNNSAVPVPSLSATPAANMPALDLPTTASAPHAMLPLSTGAVSAFDGAIVEGAGTASQSHTSTSTQTLSANAVSPEALSSSLLKDSVKVVRMTSPLPQTISHNIGLQVSKAVSNGQTDFTIRIDPPELGRVNVKVEFSNDGSMRAMVSVDTKEALNLLQRDAHVLERALGDLGAKLDQGSLNFSLKDQNKDAANDEMSAQKNADNNGEFDDALNNDEDIIADILPYVDASRTLDIRI